MVKTQQSQYEIMIGFMEKHSDIKWTGRPQERARTRKKWKQLVKLLNHRRTKEETKSLAKWRKAWSDLKTNTKRKAQKFEQLGPDAVYISPFEKRILKIIDRNSDELESNGPFKIEGSQDLLKLITSTPSAAPTGDSEDVKVSRHRSRSRSASSKSARDSSADSVSKIAPKKKKKKNEQEISPEGVQELTTKYLEYEKEKEKMAHEQEMARIKQNEKLLSIVDKMVNVLETLGPSIQNKVDDSNGEG